MVQYIVLALQDFFLQIEEQKSWRYFISYFSETFSSNKAVTNSSAKADNIGAEVGGTVF